MGKLHFRYGVWSFALAFVVASCGGGSVSQTDATPDPVIVSDAAGIWCDENRWKVVARASQLALAVPSPTTPIADILAQELDERLDAINSDSDLGRVSGKATLAALDQVREDALEYKDKFDSGEWHEVGVHDDPWAAYQADESAAYSRACQAAFDLR